MITRESIAFKEEMTMQNYLYAISDIHGMADLFKKLLTDYDPKLHQLLLIGDLNDRGPKSKECFLLGKKFFCLLKTSTYCIM